MPMEPEDMRRWLMGQTGLHPANPSGRPWDARTAAAWSRGNYARGEAPSITQILMLRRVAARAGMEDEAGYATVKKVLAAAVLEGYARSTPVPPAPQD
jgi:hypothetical protein